MKGFMFNQFFDYVEQTMSYSIIDKIIGKCNLESGGAYTSIGTYSSQEMLSLVAALSEETNQPVHQILLNYGEYLFGIFCKKYPQFIQEKSNVFQFLSSVETYIHTEVKKFYKDAQLPHFACTQVSPDQFIMVYTSSRPLTDLAEGLISGCIKYHQEDITISREDIAVKHGAKAKFTLTRKGRA